ncbi:hypothetical protein [Allobranchiibius sp. GilTou73]|uniref:hypothetical protein n=1 Tax=Allobranchiibius sp. GilTou73 TaxID=2904523 RepID=UPI001F2CE4F2|nr:hypothetical protein [Allobranchiibius sp. GilTou73]UIJ33952.1 hypothetical protein LVQ62_12485 [Allobranchiibius sp. GilTou73]
MLTVALLVWIGRGRMVLSSRPDPALSVLTLVGLPAASVYGAALIRNITAVEEITNGVSHYPMQASLTLADVGSIALAASRGAGC